MEATLLELVWMGWSLVVVFLYWDIAADVLILLEIVSTRLWNSMHASSCKDATTDHSDSVTTLKYD